MSAAGAGSAHPKPRHGQPGVLPAVALILGRSRLLTRAMGLLRLACSEFFAPQFETRLFPGIRPVAVLSHPLDACIPFIPRAVRKYLSFIRVWLQSLAALYVSFGERAIPEIDGSLRDLCRLYRAAGSVYRRCQSTTARQAGPPLSPHFLLIRLFDPHLHCVPSLHVLIVCCSYLRVRKACRRLGSPGAPLVLWAYQSALRVIESVLLVKQHSLADIGPSLFVLSELFPEYDLREVRRLAGDLFRGAAGISDALRLRLRQAVLADYRAARRLRAGQPEAAPAEVAAEYLLRRH